MKSYDVDETAIIQYGIVAIALCLLFRMAAMHALRVVSLFLAFLLIACFHVKM